MPKEGGFPSRWIIPLASGLLLVGVVCCPWTVAGAAAPLPTHAFVAGAGIPSSIAVDAEGRVFLAGRGQPGGGTMFLRMYLPSGQVAWAATPTVPSAGYDNATVRLIVDVASRAYLSTRSHAYVSAGSQFSIACYGTSGGLIWQDSSQSLSNAVFGMALDSTGSLVAVGSALSSLAFSGTSIPTPSNYGFLSRITREGVVYALDPLQSLDALAARNSLSQFLDVATDSEGRVVVCGTVLGNAVLGGVSVPASRTQHQVFVASLDSKGTAAWVTLLPVTYPTLEAAYQDSLVPRVRLDADGNAYVGLTDASRQGYLAALGPGGDILWTKTVPGTVAGLVVNRAGDLFCAGSYSGRMTFETLVLTNAGAFDVFILKLRADGQLIAGGRGGGGNEDQCRDLALDAAGNPVAAGYFVGSTEFGGTILSAGATGLAGFIATFDTNVVPVLPLIVAQPASQALLPGGTAVFRVEATGVPPFRYRWRFNGTNIDRATNAIYTVPRVLLANSGVYDVLVSNPNGTTASAPAALTLQPGTPQLGDLFATRGTLVGSASEVRGTNTLFTHEPREPVIDPNQGGHSGWLSWTAPDNGLCTVDTLGSSFDTVLGVFLGGTLATLERVASNDDAGGGVPQSRVVFQATAGTAYQIAVDGHGAGAVGGITLHLSFSNAVPLILVPPLDQRTTPGADVLWSVSAVGTEPLAFQWRLNGTNIANATGPTLLIRGAKRPDAGLYDVVVSGGSGSVTSVVARLTGLLPPEIVEIAGDRRPVLGTATTLQVDASGDEPFTYQWEFQGTNLVGVTTPVLTLPLVVPATAGSYRVLVSNADGSVTSAPVSLTVTCRITTPSGPGGSVERVPDRDRYDLGQTVLLRAAAGAGFGFVRWTGDIAGTANPTTVTVTSNLVAAPLFTLLGFTLDHVGDGQIRLAPDQGPYALGQSVGLSAIAGRWYRFDHWGDGVVLPTRTALVGLTNRYTAVFLPAQPLETITVGDVTREAPVGMPSVVVDGEFITNSVVSRLGQAEVRIATTFPGATVLYTLDGTAPGFSSILYRGPFRVDGDVTVRAVALLDDLVTGQESDPVLIRVAPARWLSLHTPGGGAVTSTPGPGLIPRNAEVVLHASPWSGWRFVQWLGDGAGTNVDLPVLMDEGREITGVFATDPTTEGRGGGSIVVSPAGGGVEYGGRLRLSAVPAPGAYFAFWAGPLNEIANPVSLVVTTAQPHVVGVFVPLPPGEVALAVVSDGPGIGTAKPGGNRFRQGQAVTLAAVPDPGAVFDGWSLASLGRDNPATLTLDQSYTLTAHFHRPPALRVVVGAFRDEDGLVAVELAGEHGVEYVIEAAPGIAGPWSPARSLRLVGERGQFLLDVRSGMGSQFVRVRQ